MNAVNLAFEHHVVHFSSVNSFHDVRPDDYQRLINPTRYTVLKERPPLILCDSYGTKLEGDPLHIKDWRLTNKKEGARLLSVRALVLRCLLQYSSQRHGA